MEAHVAAADFLGEDGDVLVVRREDDTELLVPLEVRRPRQGRSHAVGRDGAVVDVVDAIEADDARVLDAVDLVVELRQHGGPVLDFEAVTVVAGGQAQVADHVEVRDALVEEDAARVGEVEGRIVQPHAQGRVLARPARVEEGSAHVPLLRDGPLGHAHEQMRPPLVQRRPAIEDAGDFEVRPAGLDRLGTDERVLGETFD